MGCGGPLARCTAGYTGPSTHGFRWTGHLFQGRFGAVVMDAPHLLAAVRNIALNPVAAGLVSHAGDWPWSSVRAHLAGEKDELATKRRCAR
jgi:putative transposase